MTISMDKQYTTRDGRPVRLLCVDGPGTHPIYGFVGGELWRWEASGLVIYRDKRSMHDNLDLIEAQPRVEYTAHLYKNGRDEVMSYRQRLDDRDEANLGLKLVARISIDVEEGHGLEGGE